MEEILGPAVKIAVFVLMLAVGMDCTGDGFRRSVARPGLIALVTFVQYLCLPALMLAVNSLMGLGPALATALLLIGACPSGTISNAFTFLARGNTALSVTLTVISNAVAFVATPLALAAAARIAGGEISESLRFPPGPLLQQLLMSMVLPLGLGFAFRMKASTLVVRNLGRFRALSVVLILAVILLTTLADPAEIGKQLKALVFPVLLITPLMFALAWGVAKLFRIDLGDRRAVIFELPCRNVALAMLISLIVLERTDLAYMAMAFFMLETLLILGLVALLARFSKGEAEDRSDIQRRGRGSVRCRDDVKL